MDIVGSIHGKIDTLEWNFMAFESLDRDIPHIHLAFLLILQIQRDKGVNKFIDSNIRKR